MNQEIKKCRHIWAHEIWCANNKVEENEPVRHPRGLYVSGKDTVQCDKCCVLLTKKQYNGN